MSTGQVFLTLASLVLLGYIVLNIHRMYAGSVESTVDMQMTSDAVNFGRDLSEEIQSYAYKYSQLDADFADLDDPTDPNARRSDTSQVGQIFHATVNLLDKADLLPDMAGNQPGKIAEIRVYEEVDDTLQFKAELVTSVIDMNSGS
ncbi:hypothetical protein [Rhodohalobacter sp. 614A]|uniref:hypothetical protein n=1 Tax=Rhodohalobacter sp. 614A TaxID=2908649 RepID=UPI001F32284C|nr:hypothetical protein [Rhodohalobacter sp. 614A]